MIRKMLCLLAALCLAAGCAQALAETAPAETIQAELREAFGNNVLSFLQSIDPEQEAVRLDVYLSGEDAGGLILQKTDGVLDASVHAGDSAAELQIGPEAAYLSLDGQTACLRYDQVQPILEALATRLSALNPQTYRELLSLLVQDVLLPSVQITHEGGAVHILMDLDGEALSRGLIRFGDHVTGEEKYVNALALPWFLYDAQNGGKNADIRPILAENWPLWRESLEETPLPVTLQAEIFKEDNSFRLTGACTVATDYTTFTIHVNASFDGTALNGDIHLINTQGDAMDVAVKGDAASGAFSVIMTSTGGYDMDLILEPTDDGWHFLFAGYERKIAQFRVEARVADTEEAFTLYAEAGEKRFSDDMEAYVLTARFDKQANTLAAHLDTPPAVDAQADLTGRPGETGYDFSLIVREDEDTRLTAELNVRGRLENLAGMMTMEWEGTANDHAFRLLLTSQYRYQVNGSLEVSAVYGEDCLNANFAYTEFMDVYAGSLLWTKEQKSLSFVGEDVQVFLSLAQSASGRPTALRATLNQGRTGHTVLLDGNSITVEGDGEGLTVTVGFLDDHTCAAQSVRHVRHKEERMVWTLSLDDGALTLTGLNEDGEEVFSAALYKAPKEPFASLADSENLVSIDAAWARETLENLIDAIKFQLLPKPVDY